MHTHKEGIKMNTWKWVGTSFSEWNQCDTSEIDMIQKKVAWRKLQKKKSRFEEKETAVWDHIETHKNIP